MTHIRRLAGPLLVGLLASAAFGAPAARAANFGVYGGNGCSGVAKIPQFEQWAGHPVNRVLDFVAANNWASFKSDSQWVLGCWQKAGHPPLTLSVPMLVTDGQSSFAQGAAGAYTDHFVQLAKDLVSHGYGDAIIRLGWEFNGGWYPWSAKKDPQNFVPYWRVIVQGMRSVPGARFRFDWCPALGFMSPRTDSIYPGDDVVDIIGSDVYSTWWNKDDANPAHLWTTLLKQSYGLQWQADFAAQHHKPISFPEWGTGTRPDGHGSGDNPLFVTNMIAWISTHNVAYNDYWNYPAHDYNSELSTGKLPNAGAAFKAGYARLIGP